MTFEDPGESDTKMTQNLTLAQRKVIFGAIFEPLFLDPEKSFLSHRKCHFWVRDLWPNGVSQFLEVPEVRAGSFFAREFAWSG